MTQPLAVPDSIAQGVAALRAVENCQLISDPEHDELGNRWIVRIELRVEAPGQFVGKRTAWCVLIDENYPFGDIGVYPSSAGGLTVTFQHQEWNAAGPAGRGWRGGKLCLDARFRRGTPTVAPRDPIGDEEIRLRWYAERALQWLNAAATGVLVTSGDPFELPARPRTGLKNWNSLRVVHDEAAEDLSIWTRLTGKTGSVALKSLVALPTVLCAAEFSDEHGMLIRKWRGRKLEPFDKAPVGMWWLWPSPVVLQPWQAPKTWGELRRAGKMAQVDVDAYLKRVAPRLRGREQRAVLLVGYRIPRDIGGEVAEVHWDALLMPSLPAPSGTAPRGFRANAIAWWQRDRNQSLGDSTQLEWLATENWSSERLGARGRLARSLRGANICLVGLGALGSKLAEHLARAGATSITLIDGQVLTAGNICRHTATLADVGASKVAAVRRRLLQVSTVIEVKTVDINLAGNSEFITDAVDEFDVVIDCTASDAALSSLAKGWWAAPRAFASFSLGDQARRLYSFGSVGNSFPHDQFSAAIIPWLESRAEPDAQRSELREGPGCWSPLFPARDDDVSLAAAICVRELESLITRQHPVPRLRVFERQEVDGEFTGFVVVARGSS